MRNPATASKSPLPKFDSYTSCSDSDTPVPLCTDEEVQEGVGTHLQWHMTSDYKVQTMCVKDVMFESHFLLTV